FIINRATGVLTVNAGLALTAGGNASTIDGTTVGGTTPAAGTFTTLQANGNFVNNSFQGSTPTSGQSITVPNGISLWQLTPAATLATLTITMPAAPVQHQIVRVASTQAITTLTVNGNAGQTINGPPTTLAANSSFAYIYHTTTWYRLQ